VSVELLLSHLSIVLIVLLLTLQHLVSLHCRFLHVAQVLKVILSRRIVQVSEVHTLVVESSTKQNVLMITVNG
jgi:hypothetical protein